MLDNFNRSNIDLLLEKRYDVTIAGNFHTDEDINSREKIDRFCQEMKVKGVRCIHIGFSRRIGNIGAHIKSIGQVRKLLTYRFDLIHCHSPICAAIVRAEAARYRKQYGTRVIYTAHGFHFYTGAPLINWLVFYPVEKLLSYFTDVLITINKEDYKRAKRKLHAVRIIYIPGIGIDIEKFKQTGSGRIQKRKELGLKDNSVALISAGELNKNKNHDLVLQALSELKNRGKDISNIRYYICGQGELNEYLSSQIRKLGLSEQVFLLGYRKDISELLGACDIYLQVSQREGLPVSLMEGMAAGLPSIVTKIRGNSDLVRNGREGFLVGNDKDAVAESIADLAENKDKRRAYGRNAGCRIRKFDLGKTADIMSKIYDEEGIVLL